MHRILRIEANAVQIAGLFFVLACFLPTIVEAGSQTFTSSGTFTVPAYSSLTVTVWGSGGGGSSLSGVAGNGSAGGQSSFNGAVIANGGDGGTTGTDGSGGTASGGDTNTTGNSGSGAGGSGTCQGGSAPGGGSGGSNGGGGSTPGGAGAGERVFDTEFSVFVCGGSGGSGGRSIKTYSSGQLTVSSGISVVVGAGGGSGGPFGGAGARGEVQITWTDPPAATCSLSASPATIPYGATTTLSWSTANATAASIDQGIGNVTPVASGQRAFSTTTSKTLTMTVTGDGAGGNCSATVTVSSQVTTSSRTVRLWGFLRLLGHLRFW